MTGNNTDKELLEMAAKAVGFAGEYRVYPGEVGFIVGDQHNFWSPLVSNRDCLQMEIDLRFAVQPIGEEWVIYRVQQLRIEEIARDKDRQRASTMAAAAIGRTL